MVSFFNFIHITVLLPLTLPMAYPSICLACAIMFWPAISSQYLIALGVAHNRGARMSSAPPLVQASQPILSSLIRQAHCSYAGCLIGSKRPVYTWSMHA